MPRVIATKTIAPSTSPPSQVSVGRTSARSRSPTENPWHNTCTRGDADPPNERDAMPEDRNDQFDNLFEPFDLQDPPDPSDPGVRPVQPTETGQQPIAPGPAAQVYCASCASPNDAANRHCEQCGARLQRSQTPIAPQPMLRTTAGARALVVLSAIVLGVALLAVVINVFGGDEPEVGETTETTVTTLASVPIAELSPIRIDCTSELDAFPCQALIDDDPTNRWNATSDGIIGAELTFFFSPPVQITEMFLVNVDDDEAFTRNSRIRGMEVIIDDLSQSTIVELDDTNAEPQRVQIRSLRTSSLTIRITSAYPGASYDGKEPFTELALQEVQFFGRVAPEATGTP